MSNYSHTSFGRMLGWVADERRWSMSTERRQIVREANRIRQWLYSAYVRLKIAVDVEECVQASDFCLDCNDCSNCYVGISLPPEFIGAASIWVNNESFQINSRWREYQDGIHRSPGKRLEATYVGVPAPTERDVHPCGVCAHYGFQATDVADNGKIVLISYKDVNKVDHLDQIVLKHNQYVQTASPVKSVNQPAGITLPEDLCGGVIVAQMDTARILSEYKPWEHKPSYRRLSLPVCCGQSVLVRGTRRYHDLYYNHETAETGNELAIIAVARFLKHSSSADPAGGQHQLAKFHEQEALKYLTGDQNRETGASAASRISHLSHQTRAQKMPRLFSRR